MEFINLDKFNNRNIITSSEYHELKDELNNLIVGCAIGPAPIIIKYYERLNKIKEILKRVDIENYSDEKNSRIL